MERARIITWPQHYQKMVTGSSQALSISYCAALLCRFAKLAKELDVVLPLSYFEKANNAFYNSLAVIDADGSVVSR